MIKAIFFDVDGTLISHKHGKIPDSTFNALQILKEKNIKVFLATGRHMLELAELPLYNFPFDGYALLNGQLTLNENKEYISSNPICPKAVEKIIPLFTANIMPIVIVEEKRLYINYINDFVHKAQSSISSVAPPLGRYNGDTIFQLTIFTDKESDIQKIRLLDNCKMIKWHDQSYDVISSQGDKTSGIKALLNYYHIDQRETMAFGDGQNDIEMLRFAHIGIAMGNATDEVKSAADFVTKDIDDDGISFALKHFDII